MQRKAILLTALFFASPSEAQVHVGDSAPAFETQGVIAGKPLTISLSHEIERGGVAIFFFPAAFVTGGVNEMNEISGALSQFEMKNTHVVAMSYDSIEKLTSFSQMACCNRIQFAQATPNIISAYGVRFNGSQITRRVTFLINRSGRVTFSFDAMAIAGHVNGALAAAQALPFIKRDQVSRNSGSWPTNADQPHASITSPPARVHQNIPAAQVGLKPRNTPPSSAASGRNCMVLSIFDDDGKGDEKEFPSHLYHYIRNTCSYPIVVSYCILQSRQVWALRERPPEKKCDKQGHVSDPTIIQPNENQDITIAFTNGGFPVAMIVDSCALSAASSGKCVAEADNNWRKLGSPSVSEDVPAN